MISFLIHLMKIGQEAAGLSVQRATELERRRAAVKAQAAWASLESQVRMWNAKTQEVTLIPRQQLPTGMAEVEMPGVGLVWAMGGILNQKEPIHQSFPSEALDVVIGIKETLEEVFPQSLEKWEEDFRRVPRLEVEVAKWLRVADAYKSCTQGKHISLEAKQDYFKVISTCSISPRSQVLDFVRCRAITQAEAVEVIAFYYGDRG